MLKSLIYINLKGMFFRSTNKRKSTLPAAVFGLLMLFVFGMVGFSIGSMLFDLLNFFNGMGLDWFYFSLVGILSFCLCFFFSIFATKSQLFEAGDNEFLLSIPVKPVTILASRLISLLALNYLYSALFMIPAFIVYLILGSFTAIGVISFFVIALTLPMLALAFSCFFGWIMALVASKMRNKNTVTMILSFVFLGLYLMICFNSSQYITMLMEQSQTVAASVRQAILPAYLMGDAIANGNTTSLLLFVLIAIVPFILMVLLLSRSFITITTSNKGKTKAVYKEKILKTSGIGMAMLKKELQHFFSSPIYILNASMGSFLAILLTVVAVVQAGVLRTFAPLFDEVGIIAAILITSCISMNLISAPSVSLEGKTLWICRTLPVQPKTILLSKVMTHFVITEASVLLCVTVLAVLLMPAPVELLIMYLLPTVFAAFTALFGVVVNLRFPRFDWVSETQVVKQSASVFVCMLVNIAIITVFAIFYTILLSTVMSLTAFASICTALFVAISAVLYMYLCKKGTQKFSEL